ncbi:MAG: hypothetical protein K0Q51_720 [Rickettsiaceae bacterium]|jgi:hypothetical protein|nr:hypothetical protein [Rickettsiaceae bacterium]
MTPNNMPQLDLEKRIKNMLAMDFNLENAGGSKRISLAQLDGITIIPDLNNPDTYLLLDKRKGNKELAKVRVDSNRFVRFPSATDKEKAFTYMGFALKDAELAMNTKGTTGQVSSKTSSMQNSSSSELSSSDELEKRASEKLTEQELATWRRYNEAKKNLNYKEQYNPEIHNIIQKLYSAEEKTLKHQAVEEVKRRSQSQSTSKSNILEARENGEIKIPDNYPAPITVKKNDGLSKKTVTTYSPSKPTQGYAPLDIEMDYSNGKMQLIINGQNIQLKPGVTTYITVDPQGKVKGIH